MNETFLKPEPVLFFTSFDSRERMGTPKLGGAAETGSCVNTPPYFSNIQSENLGGETSRRAEWRA